MKEIPINQMSGFCGGAMPELSDGCKLSIVGIGLAYASLFCVTGVVGAALAVLSLPVAAIDMALSCR